MGEIVGGVDSGDNVKRIGCLRVCNIPCTTLEKKTTAIGNLWQLRVVAYGVRIYTGVIENSVLQYLPVRRPGDLHE